MQYRQNPGIAWREIEGEAVLVDSKAARLLVLNPAGLALWRLLEADQTEESLAKALGEQFSVGAERAIEDVRSFLGTLAERNLIESVHSNP